MLKVCLITLSACAFVQGVLARQPTLKESFVGAKKGLENISAEGLVHLSDHVDKAVADTFSEDLQRFKRVGEDFKKGIGVGIDGIFDSWYFVLTTPLRIGLKTAENVGSKS